MQESSDPDPAADLTLNGFKDTQFQIRRHSVVLHVLIKSNTDFSAFIQVVPAGSAPSQESGSSSPGESGGESGSEGKTYRSKEQLMLRANSLKKALRQIIEQAEKGNSSQTAALIYTV